MGGGEILRMLMEDSKTHNEYMSPAANRKSSGVPKPPLSSSRGHSQRRPNNISDIDAILMGPSDSPEKEEEPFEL